MLWILVSQVSESVNRVAWLGHGELYIRGSKLKIIFNRQLHHLYPVKFVNQGLPFFERILWTYDKPHLIQIGTVMKCVCNDQMTNMYGIEGTEIETDFQNTSVLKIR